MYVEGRTIIYRVTNTHDSRDKCYAVICSKVLSETILANGTPAIRGGYLRNNQIISSADGRVIYIKQIASGEIPVSVKNGRKATLTEIAQTGILDYPCWLIGIEMTPFDVHRNGAPVDGKVILNKHIDGEFRSLKDEEALSHNERNTMVLEMVNGKKIGIVQTASRMVRRIVTYVQEGESVRKGDWVGMIKFGSQVDMINPGSCRVCVEVG